MTELITDVPLKPVQLCTHFLALDWGFRAKGDSLLGIHT